MSKKNKEKKSWDRVEKVWRINNVNKLIIEIGSRGRRFFYNKNFGYAWMYVSIHGKVWFVDDGNGEYIYTHYSGKWRNFTHGGTMRILVEKFRDYIQTGEKIRSTYFNNYPAWYANGDPWGYGIENMKAIKEKAIALGICHDSDLSITGNEASY